MKILQKRRINIRAKRFAAAVITLAMLLCFCLPEQALALNRIKASGTGWTLYEDGSFVIDGRLNPKDGSTFAWEWNDYKDMITSVKAEEGAVLPRNCENLFSDCRQLLTVDLSKADFSKVQYMALFFSDCFKLQSVDMSGINTGNAQGMTLMFGGCEKLTKLDLSSFDTSKVTTFEAMFLDCESLEELDLSSFNTSSARTMLKMFKDCNSLNKITLGADTVLDSDCCLLDAHDIYYDSADKNLVYDSYESINANQKEKQLLYPNPWRYKVSYEVEGEGPETFEGSIPEEEIYDVDTLISVAEPLTTTEKVDKDGKRGNWSFAWDRSDFTLTEDTIIKGQWSFVPEYDVTFNMNRHGQAIPGQIVDENAKAVRPEDPVDRHWIFEGWYEDKACSLEFDFDMPITENTVIYAGWSQAEAQGKWVKNSKGWWFSCDDGSYLADGIYEIDAVNYAFNDKGYMVTGWYQDIDDEENEIWYHFASSGAMEYGWVKDGGKWYYLEPGSGAMWAGNDEEGFVFEIDGNYYYLDESGAMVTGWKKIDDNGRWYYFSSSGAMSMGWTKVGTKWYYLDPEEGFMWADDFFTIDGKIYHFDESGAMVTGWYRICDDNYGTAWVHFASSGAIDKAKWIGDYYVDAWGAMVTSSYIKNGDKYYWVNKDGKYTRTYTEQDVAGDDMVYDVYDQASGKQIQ